MHSGDVTQLSSGYYTVGFAGCMVNDRTICLDQELVYVIESKRFYRHVNFQSRDGKGVVGNADHNTQNCRTENHFINYLEGHNDKRCHNSSSRESNVLFS